MSDIETVCIAMPEAKHGFARINKVDLPKGVKALTEEEAEALREAKLNPGKPKAKKAAPKKAKGKAKGKAETEASTEAEAEAKPETDEGAVAD